MLYIAVSQKPEQKLHLEYSGFYGNQTEHFLGIEVLQWELESKMFNFSKTIKQQY